MSAHMLSMGDPGIRTTDPGTYNEFELDRTVLPPTTDPNATKLEKCRKLLTPLYRSPLHTFPKRGCTCVSVSMREVATSKRLGLDRYLFSLNWFSSSNSCWLVKAVRGRRHFPSRPAWGAARGGGGGGRGRGGGGG